MSELSEVVNILITQDTVGVPQAGFGVPMFLSHNAASVLTEHVRYYGGTLEAAADWAITSPEYRFINAVFAQKPHPEQAGIGRATSVPTQKYQMAAIVARNSDSRSYKINVEGQGVTSSVASYTSDSATTIAEIHNGLVLALNAVVGANYLATFAPLAGVSFPFTASNADEKFHATAHGLQTGDGPIQVSNSGGALPTGLVAVTNYWVIVVDANTFFLATSLANALAGTNLLISTDGTGTQTLASVAATVRPASPFLVTGTAPGNWFSLEVTDVTAMSNKQTHADPGVAADLDAILLEDNNWYCLVTGYNSEAYIQAAAAWVEAQTKIYVVDSVNTDAITVNVSIGTDAFTVMHSTALDRTSGVYYPSPARMQPAAWAGRVLPIEPGGETWAFKTLALVTPTKLTTTHRNNLIARNANWFQTVAGRNITQYGVTFNGNFLDVVRGIDWLEDDMSKAIFTTLTSNDKIGFDDPGISTIENDMVASLDRAVQRKILKANPRPVVTVPKAADVASADRALRRLPDMKFSAFLQGAVHHVIVTGVVSV